MVGKLGRRSLVSLIHNALPFVTMDTKRFFILNRIYGKRLGSYYSGFNGVSICDLL